MKDERKIKIVSSVEVTEDDTENVDDLLEESEDEDIEVALDKLANITEEMKNLSMDKILEDNKELSEDEKDILKSAMAGDGINFDMNKIVEGSILKVVSDTFVKSIDENTGLHKILPYFYTTNEEEVKIDTPLFNIKIKDLTYYLKDDFKRLALSGEGDEMYNLYLTDAMKMHDALTNVKIMVGEKNVKTDTFVEYLTLIKPVEEYMDEQFGKILGENAYKTAISLVYDSLKDRSSDDYKKFIKEIKSKEKMKENDINTLKGYFYQKLFKGKKNLPIDLATDFSVVVEALSRVFILAWERNILQSDKEMDEHINDIVEDKFQIPISLSRRIRYAVISHLRSLYTDKKNRWTFISIEKQLESDPIQSSYLYKTFDEITLNIQNDL